MDGLDLEEIDSASEYGSLAALLHKIPKEQWHFQSFLGWTFLHFACRVGNDDALKLLIQNGNDIEARNSMERTPLLYCAGESNWSALDILIQNGANCSVADVSGLDVWHIIRRESILRHEEDKFFLVLLMHNVVPTIDLQEKHQNLYRVRKGIERCRGVVIAFLQVKKASRGKLWNWDKFLLAHVARIVWSERAQWRGFIK